MNKISKLFSLVALIALVAFGSADTYAQNIAYVDTEAIIPNMTAYKAAKSEVEDYGKQLQKSLETKQASMQKYYQETAEKASKGLLTPVQQQDAEQKLQKMQADLQQEAASAEQKLMKKEQERTKPIYESFNAALKKVAKANGFSYILDKKLLLYSEGGIDATSKVKAELNVK